MAAYSYDRTLFLFLREQGKLFSLAQKRSPHALKEMRNSFSVLLLFLGNLENMFSFLLEVLKGESITSRGFALNLLEFGTTELGPIEKIEPLYFTEKVPFLKVGVARLIGLWGDGDKSLKLLDGLKIEYKDSPEVLNEIEESREKIHKKRHC